MHPAYIQAELKKREITQDSIAKELGVSPKHVSAIINKRDVSARVMRAVAAKINRRPEEVFEYFLRPPKRKIKAA